MVRAVPNPSQAVEGTSYALGVSPVERLSQPPPATPKICLFTKYKYGDIMNNEKLSTGEDILYTISETATLLKVNKNMVYELISKGYLRSIKFGCRKVTRKAILEFLDQYDGQDISLTSSDRPE